LVGMVFGLVMGATLGGTLISAVDEVMEHVKRLILLVGGNGALVTIVGTLGTCCNGLLTVGVPLALKCSGCALMCARVASTICWRSFVDCAFLFVPVIP
jgi:hypothetical protein